MPMKIPKPTAIPAGPGSRPSVNRVAANFFMYALLALIIIRPVSKLRAVALTVHLLVSGGATILKRG